MNISRADVACLGIKFLPSPHLLYEKIYNFTFGIICNKNAVIF